MPKPPKEYQKLPGQGTRSLALVVSERSRLWLATDHILYVVNQAYSERYRRFYFRDIQAIVVCKTRTGLITNIVLLALIGLFALAATGFLVSKSNDLEPIGGVFLFLGFILLVALGVNLMRGPTCVCKLQTAVQTEELPSLGRLWTARKVLRILKPKIEEAQGVLAPEELAARFAERLAAGTASPLSPKIP